MVLDRNSRRLMTLGVISLISLLGVGCGNDTPPSADRPLHPVSGRVIMNGRPVAGVVVRLHPLNQVFDPDVPHPTGTTDAEGVFQLGLDDGREGAPQGQYLVTLEWPAGDGRSDRLGGVFAEPDGSGLTAVIDSSTTELPPIEIETGG